MDQNASQHRGAAFWLVFVAVCVTSFLSALELTSVSTALPTISHDLNLGGSFVWVGNAYTMASTALLPLSGGLAQVWGRKSVMIGSLLFFALGSALVGAAQNVGMIISGRTIQGMGGGGILCLADIIVADLVPLKERGMYIGILTTAWVVAAAIGPLIGGIFSGKVTWRWLFYLNLPLCGLSLALCLLFLRLRTPRLSLREKFQKIDWAGNILIIAGTAGVAIALTWAGAQYSWKSYQILIPFLFGWILLGLALWYDARIAKEPTVPFELLANRTSLSGYISSMLYTLTTNALVYYLPVYFQASLLASPFQSSLDSLGLALTMAPSAVVAGISPMILSRYVPQTIAGWVLTIVAMALLSTLNVESSKGLWVGYQILAGIGLGIVGGTTNFPVLAPLPVENSAYALALFNFLRGFAQTWGITIGAAVVQNELSKRLPPDFVTQLQSQAQNLSGEKGDIAYAAILSIPSLPPELQSTVREAFAQSLSTLWKVMAGFAGAGLLVTILFMKEIKMTEEVDDRWGLEGNRPVDEARRPDDTGTAGAEEKKESP